VTASVYWNNTKNGIYFTPVSVYSATNPPPGWPLPPGILSVIASLPTPVVLPSQYTYLNFGKVKDKGIELGVDAAANRYVNVFANYSYQWMPIAEGLPPGTTIEDLNWPPKNRFNTGFNFSYSRYLGNLTVSYTDKAFWQDVLDARYAGLHRPVHDGQRRIRRPVARGQAGDEHQDEQSRQRRDAAAHLRRHHQAPDCRRSKGDVLSHELFSRHEAHED
jgi:hypothetical protein